LIHLTEMRTHVWACRKCGLALKVEGDGDWMRCRCEVPQLPPTYTIIYWDESDIAPQNDDSPPKAG